MFLFCLALPERHKWTNEEKGALRNYFKKYLAQGRTPGQLDCLGAIKKESCLKKFSWRQVKYAVKNLNATESRRMKKHLN